MKSLLRPFNFLMLLGACQATGDDSITSSGPTQDVIAVTIPCDPVPPTTASAKKVLFVGNSLTYSNDLPGLVAAIGTGKGLHVETQMLAFANYALQDHWTDGCIQKLIKSGYYDFVVVQQGPSSQAEGRGILLQYGALIQELCKQHDTKLAFYMVWPALANYTNFDAVIQNYTEAATKTGGLLCPVGTVWKDHFDKTGDFSYYGPDSFHPSLKGSEVAADVIHKVLFP